MNHPISTQVAPSRPRHAPTPVLRRCASACLPVLLAGLLGACAPHGAANAPPVPPPATTPSPAPVPAPPAPLPPGVEGVACTMDVIQCSNGDWVGRKPPSCQFNCPAGSTPLVPR